MNRSATATSVEWCMDAITRRHDYAKAWKQRTGGKVVGYFCTYVPEELIYAVGALPVRVLGSHQPEDITDRHIYSGMWCAYCRDCLAQGLEGKYDYLDGLVNAWCCNHIWQTYLSWTKHSSISFTYQLYVPSSVLRPSERLCFESETREFAGALGAWLGQPLSLSSLERAVDVYNADRRLLRQAYELRRSPNPPVSGSEAMAMVLSSQLMDKAEHSQFLRGSLDSISTSQEPSPENYPRLLILGSETDDLDLIRLIESLGATIVADEHCTGSRYFWNDVSVGGDPVKAIADRYLERPPCPQKDVATPRLRLPHVLNLIQDYKVQGVVVIQQKFCDAHRFDIPSIQAALLERGIPSLILEVEFTVPAGQFSTRIEAFLETIRQET